MNTKVAKHLSIPENRINYSFYFLDNFGYEFVDYKKCYDAIAKWSDNLDTSESHYLMKTSSHKTKFQTIKRKSLTDYHLQLNGLLSSKQRKTIKFLTMNYTLKQLQQRVNKLIEQQGEDAYCGAWIYKGNFMTKDDGEQEYPCDEHPE